MEATGVILAALDCDLDAIEAWNRWYDLEHVPPNIPITGIMHGRRYVATPDLHRVRRGRPGTDWMGGRSAFITIYTLTGDCNASFQEMVGLREQLVSADRMFPDDKKVVREGDVLGASWAVGDPALKPDARDVPFIAHTGIVLCQRTTDPGQDAWYRDTWAPAAVAVPGVHGVWSHTSLRRDALALDVVWIEGDPVTVVGALRDAAPHHPDADVIVDAPYSLIQPLHYEFGDAMRAGGLPETVTSPPVDPAR